MQDYPEKEKRQDGGILGRCLVGAEFSHSEDNRGQHTGSLAAAGMARMPLDCLTLKSGWSSYCELVLLLRRAHSQDGAGAGPSAPSSPFVSLPKRRRH